MAAPGDSAGVRKYWSDFCAATGVDPGQRYDVFAFGDAPQMADELAELVLHGPKRATAGLLADFDNEPMPEVGAHSIVLGGDGQPLCVIRTTEVRVLPFREVDEAFAWEEGEGDRSLAYWREAHLEFFARMCATETRSSPRRWRPSANGSPWRGRLLTHMIVKDLTGSSRQILHDHRVGLAGDGRDEHGEQPIGLGSGIVRQAGVHRAWLHHGAARRGRPAEPLADVLTRGRAGPVGSARIDD